MFTENDPGQISVGGSPFAASFMPVEEAERIIQMCAEAYVETTSQDA